MKTLYIHIGTPKTGSSTLQHFFEDNRKVLLQKGIYYPESVAYEKWGGYDSTEGNFGWVTRLNMNMVEIKKTIEGMFQTSDKVLLSTENIWLEINDKASFFSDIGSVADDLEVKVIVYLRKQIDYLESHYREHVRIVLMKESIFEACDFEREILKNVKDSLDYFAMLEKIAQAVGRENVIVRPYEKVQFKNQNILDDFLDILGLQKDQSFVLPQKNFNPSISNPALELKRQMNASANAEQKLMNDCFYDILMQDGTESGEKGECAHFKSLLTYEQRQAFMQRFVEGNKKTARYYLNREGDLFLEKDDIQMQAYHVSCEELLYQTIRVFTSVFLKNYAGQNAVVSRQNSLEEKMERIAAQIQDQIQNQMQNQIQNQMQDQQNQIQSCMEQLENSRIQMENCQKEMESRRMQIENFQEQMENSRKEMECRQKQTEDQMQECRKNLMRILEAKQQEIDSLKNSSCWRATAPFRKAVDFFRKRKCRRRKETE